MNAARLTTGPARPLIVRLRNWVGDVVLGVAALRHLQQQGHAPVLVGKRWAASLLAGEGWPVHVLPASTRERVALYRRLRAEAREVDADFDRRVNTVLMPMSFSSALETRLAGLRSVGYAHEGRSWLMRQALQVGAPVHELARDWRLAQALTGRHDDVPEHAVLTIDPAAAARARARIAEHGLDGGFILLCPFAGGTFEKLDKRWPDFAAFATAAIARFGLPVVLCPGPGEMEEARRIHPDAVVLENVALGDYAALASFAALMVSNDTGPGHMAAAVGARTVSVLGPTDASRWGVRGRRARIVSPRSSATPWPEVAEVIETCADLLAGD